MSSDRPPLSPRTVSLVLFLFIAVFLGTVAVRALVRSIVGTYETFGFYSPTADFYLYRYMLFAVLPFGFNLVFGCYFALWFHGGGRRAWSGLALFVLWVVAFNIPLFLTGEFTVWPPRFEWPPSSLFLPVYSELVLFIPMGNLGAVLGYSVGGLIGTLREARG